MKRRLILVDESGDILDQALLDPMDYANSFKVKVEVDLINGGIEA